MAAINFPTATSNGQTFEADTGVIYTYVGSPPNGFWSATFATTGLTTLDNRYIAKNDGNSRQTMQTQGLKFNNGSADTILLDGVNGKVGIGTMSNSKVLSLQDSTAPSLALYTGSTIRGELKATSALTTLLSYSNSPITFNIGGSAETEALRIDGSGNVGIGTTSVDATLHVKGSYPTVHIERDHATNYSRLLLDNTANDGGAIDGIGDGVGGLRFSTSDAGTITERLRIDSSGNVGIGDTAPNGNYGTNLSVHSTATNGARVKISDGTTGKGNTDGLDIISTGGAAYFINRENSFMSFTTNSIESLRIANNGNVGIGTSSPYSVSAASNSLNIANTSSSAEINFLSSTTGFNALYFGDGATGTDRYRGYLEYAHNGDYMRFATATAERMRIDSDGDVGIGTGSAINLTASGRQTLGLNGNSETAISFSHSGSLAAFFYTSSTEFRMQSEISIPLVFRPNNSEAMRIDSSGNIGFGVSSNIFYKLTLQEGSGDANRIGWRSTSGNRKASIDCGNTAALVFRTGATEDERMRIDSTGLTVGSSTDYLKHTEADGLYRVTSGATTWNLAANGSNLSFNNANGTIIQAVTSGVAYRDLTIRANLFTIGTGSGSATDRMSIDNAGRVYIKGGDLYIQNSTTGFGVSKGLGLITDGNTDKYVWNYENTSLRFGTNSTERMRIENTGRVLIGKTATNFANQGIELRENGEIVVTRTAGECLALRRTSSDGLIASFRNTSGTAVGTIVTSSSSTAYNTSSDYRLKENVVELTAAIPRLKTLPVYRFNFISDAELTVDGFLAHEAQLVVPESVTGTHNEIDGDGKPIMQSIDQAKLVPLLTAALQEAIGRIETLEAEVAALKAG